MAGLPRASKQSLFAFRLLALVLAFYISQGAAFSEDSDELAKLKREIAVLEKENELLKRELAILKAEAGKDQAAHVSDDLFAQGTIFKGPRTFQVPSPDWGTDEIRVTVTDRSGTKFKGELFIARKDGTSESYKVEGTATNKANGVVDFKSEKKGFFNQRYKGKLNNGEIALEFSGSASNKGEKVGGTATMKPTN